MTKTLDELQPAIERHLRALMVGTVSISDGRSNKKDPTCWGVNVTGGTPEQYEYILSNARSFAAGWNEARSALRELIADRDLLLNAVDLIASWSEGDEVGGHFDEPASAELARKALAQRTKAIE